MEVLFYALLFTLGACFGSFLCCQARRLHLKQQKSTSSKKLSSRSVCLHCHYQLKWYDNIPLFSWLFLRGKCRKCHQKIGLAEFIAELGTALAFLGISITFNPASADVLSWLIFLLLLFFVLIIDFLAIYDGLYGELPSKHLTYAIICAAIILCLKEYQALSVSSFTPELIYQPILSVLLLGGLYLILYKVSKGKWVGDGDWLLGTAIALALFDPRLSLITLFLANLIACLVMAPFVYKQKHAHIYFGPFLVLAFIITIVFSDFFYDIISI